MSKNRLSMPRPLAGRAPRPAWPAPVRPAVEQARRDWLERMSRELPRAPGDPDFDSVFVQHLSGMLQESGFHHVRAALLASVAEVAEPGATAPTTSDPDTQRKEIDALIDLGITLLTRQADED